MARSGYYSWSNKSANQKDLNEILVEERMKVIFKLSRQTYGFRRVQKALQQEGIICNHKRVCRLMRKLNLIPKVKRKFKATTNSKHSLAIEPNQLKREFCVERPNKAWVGDISYISTDEGWLYLAIVIDLYSRKVKGWCMSERMTANLTVAALEMALKSTKSPEGIMFHSDRGVQYASSAFKEVIKKHHMVQSMSRKADCWDNAVSESFFGTIKQEHIYHCKFKTRREAKQAIFEYIEVFYNRQRLHSTLNYQTPESLELKAIAA